VIIGNTKLIGIRGRQRSRHNLWDKYFENTLRKEMKMNSKESPGENCLKQGDLEAYSEEEDC
jgi:hypothetical protein